MMKRIFLLGFSITIILLAILVYTTPRSTCTIHNKSDYRLEDIQIFNNGSFKNNLENIETKAKKVVIIKKFGGENILSFSMRANDKSLSGSCGYFEGDRYKADIIVDADLKTNCTISLQ